MVNLISARAPEICALPSDPPRDRDARAGAALHVARSRFPSGDTIHTSVKGA
jgi:hypothetical protein